jgi:hypothetical protein
MNMNDMSAEAERYRAELMKLYGKRSEDIKPEETPEKEEKDDTAYSQYAHEENNDTPDDTKEYNNRYPEPDLSGLDTDTGTQEQELYTEPQYVSEESMGSGTGYILVNVRAGEESSPIEGASVKVTAIVNGSRLILAEGLTNMSGTTIKFALPAPDAEHSQTPDGEYRPYSLYDVSVSAAGFFNARSVDVPVFDGITSVQNFGMIPVPVMMKSDDETVTYYN